MYKDYYADRKELGYRHIGLWLRPETFDLLQEARKLERRTATAVVERAIEEYARTKHPKLTKGEDE